MKLAPLGFFCFALLFSMVACNTSTPLDKVKNSIISLNASPQSSKSSNAGAWIIQTASGTINVTDARLEISNIRIEENSGQDVNNDSGGNDSGGSDSGTSGTESEQDISLSGPYVAQLINGQVQISKVNVFPGTYKKVNFQFTSVNGSAIQLKGSYDNAGTTTPFVLTSSYSQKIQLPLANGGITVTANSTQNIFIVFDILKWLSGLDLSKAVITNGQIAIDNLSNPEIFKAFESELTKYIEIDKEG